MKPAGSLLVLIPNKTHTESQPEERICYAGTLSLIGSQKVLETPCGDAKLAFTFVGKTQSCWRALAKLYEFSTSLFCGAGRFRDV
ncbi:hypothetical protein BaRGS_00000174 [Batillaria attramentaria]|uniref:Uncharacterized protein n=1 Tax=Batillaria attramentaria TaxID=370345 RepID=A0ABD0MCM1_9CAEN